MPMVRAYAKIVSMITIDGGMPMEGCIHDTVVFSHRLKFQAQNLAKETEMD